MTRYYCLRFEGHWRWNFIEYGIKEDVLSYMLNAYKKEGHPTKVIDYKGVIDVLPCIDYGGMLYLGGPEPLNCAGICDLQRGLNPFLVAQMVQHQLDRERSQLHPKWICLPHIQKIFIKRSTGERLITFLQGSKAKEWDEKYTKALAKGKR